MENEDEIIDSPNDEEILDNQENAGDYEDTPIETVEEAQALQEQNRQLFARAKKAEQEMKALKAKLQTKPEPKTETKQDDINNLVASQVNEVLERRELDSLELGDQLKEEVKIYAKMNNVSIKQAMNSSYIQFKVNEAKTEARNEDASILSTHKNTKRDYSNMSPSDFDCTTEQGVKDFEEYKKFVRGA
jgi:hypothetical protein